MCQKALLSILHSWHVLEILLVVDEHRASRLVTLLVTAFLKHIRQHRGTTEEHANVCPR